MSLSVSNSPVARPQSSVGEPDYVETVIRPKRGWIGVDWAELWSHRELLAFLTWRDVKVKYKQAIFGSTWAIVVPLVSVLIYAGVGILAGLGGRTPPGVPYIVYIYAGQLPWFFLATAINGGGLSLVNNQSLLSKIYLPRLFIPTSSIGTALVDMAMSSIVLAGMIALFVIKSHGHFLPSWHVVFLPALLVLLTTSALGTAYLLSALTVMFRDLRFIIPFITQLGIWLTFVAFPQSILVHVHADGTVTDYRPWLALNPFAGIVQGFRWAIIPGEDLQTIQLAASCGWAVLLLVGGLFYFKRVERRFADIA